MSHIILENRNKLHLRLSAGIYSAVEYALGHEGETCCCQIGSTITGAAGADDTIRENISRAWRARNLPLQLSCVIASGNVIGSPIECAGFAAGLSAMNGFVRLRLNSLVLQKIRREGSLQTANLIAAASREHQRLDGDRDHLGNPQALTNIDIVQIANLYTIHRNDIAIDLEFVS